MDDSIQSILGLKVLIVEDEARIARRIERLLNALLGKKLVKLLKADDLAKATQLLAEEDIDLLLLDLNLNGSSGFDLLKQATAQSFHTIIISAYEEQAITAFEYGVLDFIPKPFNAARLEKALKRLTQTQSEAAALRYLAVRKRQQIQLIDLQEIKYIQGAGIYSELHLQDGTTALHNKTLDRLAQLLPLSFLRIHKSYIVPQREAEALIIQAGGKYQLRLKDDSLLPIGRTRYKQLKKEWFAE